MMKKSMAGFTLAEVLTTLMVIGVVAAMTIPTLMNSTNDQQLKVAYKKAVSVLSQGVQLMTAKEAQCKVTDSESLAKCFADNVLSGDVVYDDGSASNSGTNAGIKNVVRTNDGMAYAFFFAGTPDATQERLIEEICGTGVSSDSNYAFGTGNNAYDTGKCYVVVDVNGLGKGAKYFNSAAVTSGNAIASAQINGSEQIPMIIYGEGVRPVFSKTVSALNKGYTYMYGEGATPYSGT